MIRFIYGNPGTGKTNRIFDSLKEDAISKRKALLIVPEQMAVSTERRLIQVLPPSAQLHIEVVNFTRLANKLFRIYGGLTYNFAPLALQKLLIWQAIKKATPFLTEYKPNGNDDMSLATAMLATYKELSAAGISPEMLQNATGIDKNSQLYNKLKDISTVCAIYSAILSESFTDESNELIKLSELIENCKCLSGYNVYIDGFSSFTGIEHRIIKSMMSQVNELWISLPIEGPSSSAIDSVSIKRCSNKLRRDAASLGIKNETIVLSENIRTDKKDLSFIAENIWSLETNSICESASSIELWKAADIYDECECVAAKARELVENGYKYRDIAIISRNADKYKGIIEPALESMELKYFFSEKTDPSLCPASRLILSAIRIINFGWRREDVISHLKTGLFPVSSRDVDIFEKYTATWNISGRRFTDELPWNMNPDGYNTNITEQGVETLSIANSVKSALIVKFTKYISELKAAETCKDLCIATYNYLEDLSVSDSLKELSRKFLRHGKLREASETARMYDVIIDTLDCVCNAFPDNDMPDLLTFSTALRTALEESELGTIPTSSDEITIGSANMFRADDVKCVIVLGACDGEFPANSQNTGLLTDSDRDILSSTNLPLEGDREIQSSDELFYFKRALSAPSERLIIFTRADSEPSIAFSRVAALVSSPIKNTADELLFRIKTYRTLSEYLPLLEGTEEGEALVRLSKDLTDINVYSREERNLLPLSAQKDIIESNAMRNLIGSHIRLSQSKIETFVKCPFSYSCKYFLKLNEDKKAKFSFDSIGTFVHQVLEKYLYFVFIENGGIIPSKYERDKRIDSIIDNYINDTVPDDNGKKSARLLHLIERLRQLSVLLIEDITSELSDSDFKPEFFELSIGSPDIPSVVFVLDDGTKMSLSGFIDRVDTYRKDGKVYVRVVDYKTGSKTFSINDIKEGINLQLLLYIYALTSKADEHTKSFFGGTPIPAAITYISAVSSKIKTDRISDEANNTDKAMSEIKRSGIILDDADVVSAISRSCNNRYLMKSRKKSSAISMDGLNQLFNQVEQVITDIGSEITGGNANAIPKDPQKSCNFCPYRIVCRRTFGEDE